MGEIREHERVLLLLAIFSRYDAALHWARQRAVATWGPVALESEVFAFSETRFYEKSMGAELSKVLVAFTQLVDPAVLPDIKHRTNRWEQEYVRQNDFPELRPLNIDPGYLTEAKLVLASTKDRDHRIYLSRGIFAENTLYYRGGAWQTRPWTYPNYRRSDYHQFLSRCRDYFRGRKRAARAGSESDAGHRGI